ncbi:MAG: hypothetical protein ABEJ99_05570 [Candidatus Nanohaloarchaea archaeon]
MDLRKVVVAILLFFILAGAVTVTGFSGGGSVNKVTACNNGVDDDGDGLVDAVDPGCSYPLYKDDSEKNVYDLDASWVFSSSGDGDLTSSELLSGPSVFYGWALGHKNNGKEVPDNSSASQLGEMYVKNPGNASSDNYGGGKETFKYLTKSGAGIVTRNKNGKSYSEFVSSPGKSASNTCGDGIRNEDSKANFDCPEDYGLPADDGGSSGSTLDRSGQNITDTIGSFDSYVCGSCGGDTNTDTVNTKMDLDAMEFNAGQSGDGPSSVDITGKYLSDTNNAIASADELGSSHSTVRFKDNTWSNAPDYFIKSEGTDELWAVTPTLTGSLGTIKTGVRTYYLNQPTSETDYDQYKGTVQTSCSPGANCSLSGISYTGCADSDRTDESHTEYYFLGDTKTVSPSFTSTEYTTTQDSSKTGYIESPISHTNSLNITVHTVPSNSVHTWKGCSNPGQTYYDLECMNGKTCTLGGSVSVYGSSSDSFVHGYSSKTVDFKYQTLKLITKKVWDTDPGYSSSASKSVKKILFQGDSFHNGASSGASDIIQRSFNGEGYFSYRINKGSEEQSNDPAVSVSNFGIVTVGSDDKFHSHRNGYATYDADGPNGQGDGYVSLSTDKGASNNVYPGGFTQQFLMNETVNGNPAQGISSSSNYVSTSMIPKISCPSDYITCIASVDVALNNFDKWGSIDPSSGKDFKTIDVKRTGASMGACMMYKTLTGDKSVKCKTQKPANNKEICNGKDDDGDGLVDEGGVCGGPPTGGGGNGNSVCGDQHGEHTVFMEGPEIDQDYASQFPGDYQGCIDTDTWETRSTCLLNGKTYPEGSVEDVGSKNGKYEMGGHSPDREVCLDLEGTGIGNEGDSVYGDNQGRNAAGEDYGGEWYDLDSNMAQKYLKGVYNGKYTIQANKVSTTADRTPLSDPKDNNIIDSNGDGKANGHDIDYFWKYDPSPSDPTYNPGDKMGVAIEDDCGNPRFDNLKCSDEASQSGRQQFFWSMMAENASTYRDDDYQPLGLNKNTNGMFSGYVNKLQDLSHQLDKDMTAKHYDLSKISIWEDSNGSVDSADQYAITKDPSWSISNRGVPYPPFSTYYRSDSARRTNPDSAGVGKQDKVFANSYAAVAGPGIDGTKDLNGNTITTGDGVWVDPDNLRKMWNSNNGRNYLWASGTANWTDQLDFRMDITGPDSGLGYDTGDGAPLNRERTRSQDYDVVYGDIYFQGEKDGVGTPGQPLDSMNKPMCGDDKEEYLIEALGESVKSKKFNGQYACSTTKNKCVDMSSTPRIIGMADYRNTHEPDEPYGRLKQDQEFCGERTSDIQGVWYDQDYGKIQMPSGAVVNTCDVNSRYGDSGVRWFDKQYINKYPKAVAGGIDDDWNRYLELQGHKTVTSPVPTGSPNKSKATVGFCGGDDKGEYLVTQQCQTDLCQTDRGVIGVKKNPDACIFDRSQSKYPVKGYSSGDPERVLYQPGDKITFQMAGENKQISCFNSNWYGKWPIVFHKSKVDVQLGETKRIPFDIINVRDSSMTFNVDLEKGSKIYRFSRFAKSGSDHFQVSVPAQSSKTYDVLIRGTDKSIDASDLYVSADAVNNKMFGEDHVTVDVVNQTTNSTGVVVGQPKSVPGMGMVQLMVLMIMGAVYFFLQS